LQNRARQTPFDRIGLDNRQRALNHRVIIAGPNSAIGKTSLKGRDAMVITNQDDADVHKGVVESERPNDKGVGNPAGAGIDENGLPDDPVATAQDEIGANEDKSQG
jgi:hypothetical protein